MMATPQSGIVLGENVNENVFKLETNWKHKFDSMEMKERDYFVAR